MQAHPASLGLIRSNLAAPFLTIGQIFRSPPLVYLAALASSSKRLAFPSLQSSLPQLDPSCWTPSAAAATAPFPLCPFKGTCRWKGVAASVMAAPRAPAGFPPRLQETPFN
eukprot:1158687-Pelagomonas_calceolata.AAC.4